jgi:hypothetical protein
MNKLKSKRVLAVVTALAVVGGGGAAIAAAKGSSSSGNGFLASVARHLGVSTQKLQDATKAAAVEQVDADLKAGRITKAQADELKARINSGEVPFFGGPHRFGDFGHDLGHGPLGGNLSAAAGYLDLTVPQLLQKLSGGQSLAQVAKLQSKSVEGLKQAMLDAATKQFDKAVSAGMLTRAQADQELSELKSRLDGIINGSFRGPGEQGAYRFRGGPARSDGFWGAPA